MCYFVTRLCSLTFLQVPAMLTAIRAKRCFHVLPCGEIIGGGDIYLRSRKPLIAVEVEIASVMKLVLGLPSGGIIILTKEEFENPLFFLKVDEVEEQDHHIDLLLRLEKMLCHFLPDIFEKNPYR